MKTSNLCRYLAVWLIVSPLLSASAVTFTSDAVIGFDDTNYDGADIVITNCTLTVDGPHSFASLQILQGGTLTHTAVAGGLFSSQATITNEEHVLVGTTAETLVHANVVLASLLVLDAANSVIYSNGVDYVVTLNPNGLAQLQRTDASTIPDGATVRVAYDTSSSVPSGLNLAIAGDMVVEAGSTINVDARGYDRNLGPGSGGSLGGILSGGGGGHGGYGGLSASNAPGGNVYDSILKPADKGSSGGNGYRGYGGAGGGAVKLVVGGALRVDGSLSANGADGMNERSGGGAGGSLWLTAQTLSGAGSLTAQGGRGEPSLGGGGGGGRVALYVETNTFTGQIQARGGQGATVGGAGTIYFKSPTQSVGSVLVDNGGSCGTNTLLVAPGSFNLTVQGGAILAASSPVTLGNLLVNSNGWVSLSIPSLVINGDATIRPGGGIIGDGTGFSGGSGPGVGRISITTNGIAIAGGGGYGGPGASTALSALGGLSYGTLLRPIDRGSGGGNVSYAIFPNGGSGGGAIQLTVTGTLQVDGRLSANGLAGLAAGSGG
ncbi:MAG TPA: hypothetical protein VNZ22_20550, partial [Bacillota bacterium]|nr:hypothetical protein [Bacillota bacterium]